MIDENINTKALDINSIKKVWYFEYIDEETVKLKKYKGKDKYVKVPSMIGKRRVVELVETFKNNENITTVIIPKGVEIINSFTFSGCSSLWKVKIGKDVKVIGKNAFEGCENLFSIDIPKSVCRIEEGGFLECKNLSDFNILANGSELTICEGVFRCNYNLKSIVLPKRVVGFCGLTHFENIVIENRDIIIINEKVRYTFVNIKIPDGTIGDSLLKVLLDYLKNLPDYFDNEDDDININGNFYALEVFLENSLNSDLKNYIPFEHLKAMFSSKFDNAIEKYELIINSLLKNEIDCKSGFDELIENSNDSNYLDKMAWDFIENDDGTICITGYRGKEYSAIIPARIKRKKVVGIIHSNNSNFKRLSHIVIQEGIIYIGDSAFENCSTLINIHLPNTLEKINDKAFKNSVLLSSVAIPNNVNSIGEEAFRSCIRLENINLSEKLEYIGSKCFKYCERLDNVKIPNTVIEIGKQAFSNCYKLEQINLSDNIEVINDNMFSYCSSLKAIAVPKKVTVIGECAFYSCISLNRVKFNDNLSEIGRCSFAKCSLLEEIEIKSKLLHIKFYAFDSCISLKKVKLPDTVTEIWNYAFANCESLVEINIPNSLKQLKYGTFFGCDPSLQDIDVPNNVKFSFYHVFGE